MTTVVTRLPTNVNINLYSKMVSMSQKTQTTITMHDMVWINITQFLMKYIKNLQKSVF